MKTLKYFLIAAAAVPALVGTGYAQTPKPATPPAAAPQEAPKATAKTFTGELVAADQATRTVIVKHMVDKKPMHVTFSVEEGALSTLTTLKPGDHVKVTYVEMGEKRIIKTIAKA